MAPPKPWENDPPKPRAHKVWKETDTHDASGHFKLGHSAALKVLPPEQLWQRFETYKAWVEANPIKEELVFSAREGIRRTSVSKMRAMTWAQFAPFVGVTARTLHQWRKDREDLQECLQFIEEAMFGQKFTGAAAGVLNGNIIARELGLADKQQVDAHVAPPPKFTIEPVKSGTYLPPEAEED